MRKLIIAMHVSLDGFVAGPNGEMDFIHVDQDLFDITGRLTDNADTALYGRVTYEMMDSYWPTAAAQPDASRHDIEHSGWYNTVQKVVASRTITAAKDKVQIISSDLEENIQKLKQEPGKNILMFGSPTVVHELTAAGLIDEFWLFINPVLLGSGIPLFKEGFARTPLYLMESRPVSNGVIMAHYWKA